MAWSEIEQYRVAQLINASAMNTLKDDINYLLQPSAAEFHHDGSGANYTVTTLSEDIDAVNFNLSITTTGGLVKAMFYGQFKSSSLGPTLRVGIVRTDPISFIGRNMFWDYDVEVASSHAQGEFRGWVKYFQGLPAGTHSFKMVWGIPSGTGTLLVPYKPHFWVWEV